MEWELSKENVQPLKAGRNVEVLNDALKSKAEGPARSCTLEEQGRKFLEAIENYVGEDPLLPWIRYIKWVKDARPSGGAHSDLLKVLEKCTRQFQKDERYRRDVRYLRIWVEYADCCSDPSDVFAFLEANDIGQEYALFYEAYATSMELRRKFSAADEIYNLGLQRSAQSVGRLESMYKSFLNRMLRRGERKFREERQTIAYDNENDMQFRAFGPPSVYSGDAVGQQAQRHRSRPAAMPPPRQQASRAENAGLSVFVDPEFGGPSTVSAQEAGGKESQGAAWSHIGSVADKRKENVQQPSKWSDAKIGQKAHGQHGPRSDLKILVDEEFAEEHKPKKNVTKSAAPTLRLKLEDMQKIKRHSPDFKGSFLDLPKSFPAPTTQGSTQFVSDSSRNVSAQDASSTKSHPETVFGYDQSLLNANGTERSFEEVRLSVWNEIRPTLYVEDKEISTTTEGGPNKSEDSHRSPRTSFNPDNNRLKESRYSTGLNTVVAGNVSDGSNVGLQSASSQRNVDGDEYAFNQKASPFLKCSILQGVSNHMMNSDEGVIIDCLSREPAAAKEDPSTDGQLQPQATNLPSSRPDQAPIVPFNFVPMHGDETVAIKRFAEEVIVLGSDPKVNSIDAVSHHGLVEPTITTKEALADILDMFNKPLECVNAQSKVRKPKETKKRSSNPVAKSSGFEIFVDDDLGIPSPVKPKKSEKRAKAVSGGSSANPVVQTRGFQSFADENSGLQRPGGSDENGRSINRPLDSIFPSTGFDIYEDEDLGSQGPSNLSKNTGKHRETAMNSALDPILQSGGFDIFVDEDFQKDSTSATCPLLHPALGTSTFQILADDDLIVKGHLQPAKSDDSCASQILADNNLVMKRPLQTLRDDAVSAFQVFVDDDFSVNRPLQPARNYEQSAILGDDDLVMERPLQAAKADHLLRESTVESSSCQSAGVDDQLRELSLSSNKLNADSIENHLSLVEDKCNAKNLFGMDDCGFPGTSEEAASKDFAAPSQRISDEFNVAIQLSASPQRPTSLDKCQFAASSPNAQREEINAATLRMTVDPWEERNLQDLLTSLKPQIEQYEGFFESNEKYGGSTSISSLRSCNARNKVLQLGNNTYHVKGCVGQGAFAQVFEVEDEDDDFFETATKLALKFQKPACLWEFYIYRQLDMRVCTEDRCYYGQVRRFHLYSDSSFLICDYGDKGTLQDVVNAYLAKGQRMEETLCVFYTIEMLRILEVLHGVGIIHGDFKPDNLLIRDDSDELVPWTPDRTGCWKSQGLSLIDWGRSIDLTLYPEGIQFMGDCKTDSFRCPEMLEHRPWNFQVDTFGLCGVVHCLLHGSYMQIEKTLTADGQNIYRPKSSYRRYWNVELWRGFFEALLNVSNPQLSVLRKNFEDHLTGNSLGRKVKELLSKQTIMMFTHG